MPAFDIVAWAVLAPTVLLASFVFQAAGFGAGLVAVPLATIFLEPTLVLPVLALLELVNAARLVATNAGSPRLNEAAPLIVFSAIGTAIGVGLLVNLPTGWLMIGMAVFILGFLAHQRRRGPQQRAAPIARAWVAPAGLASGLGSALFGMGGPPYLIYLHLRGLPLPTWRATFVVVGLFSLIWRISGFTLAGFYAGHETLLLALALLPSALLAFWLAEQARPHLNERLLRRLVHLLLTIAALTLIVRGIRSLTVG